MIPQIVGAGIGGALGADAARDAARDRAQGIREGQIAIEGGMDQALTMINGAVDPSLMMNRPYTDAGIGAMANVNAMLGISAPAGGVTREDLDRMLNDIDTMHDRGSRLKKERRRLNRDIALATGSHRRKLEEQLAGVVNDIESLRVEFHGAQRNIREARRQYDLGNQAQAATTEGGVQAIRPFEFDGENFNEDPSYQFRMEQGLEARNRAMGAGGFLNSGNRAMAIEDYAQGLASTEYQSAFDRGLTQWRSQFDVLNANLQAAGIGQSATNMNIGVLNNAAMTGAQTIMAGTGQIAAMHADAGNAGAAGIMGANNAFQQALGQAAYGIGNSDWFEDESGGGSGSGEAVDYDTGGGIIP